MTQCDRANLTTQIVDRAKLRFKEVYESKCLKNRSTPAIAAACIFIACREESVARSFKEIVAISRVPKKDIGRCFKVIIKTLPSLRNNQTIDHTASADLLNRMCSNLSLARK